jgi:DNA repair protein RadC
MRDKSIRYWPDEERPREKLFKEGEHKLSNSELLAILIRNGVKGQSALDLSRMILQRLKTFRNISHADLSVWGEFKGVGVAKIAQIKAAIEIGRRFREEDVKKDKPVIKSSKDAAGILMPRMKDLPKEIFKILCLDSRSRIIDILEITEGTVNQANPIIREIFQKALNNFAASIICVHNHPSGDPNPSSEDTEFTRRLTQAGDILQVMVLDHIIIGYNKYFSFIDSGSIG